MIGLSDKLNEHLNVLADELEEEGHFNLAEILRGRLFYPVRPYALHYENCGHVITQREILSDLTSKKVCSFCKSKQYKVDPSSRRRHKDQRLKNVLVSFETRYANLRIDAQQLAIDMRALLGPEHTTVRLLEALARQPAV